MKWVNLNKRAPGCNRIVLCIDCYDVAVLFIFTVTVYFFTVVYMSAKVAVGIYVHVCSNKKLFIKGRSGVV